MRRISLVLALACGCFEDPEPKGFGVTTAATTVAMTASDEASSSDGESSGDESSSTTDDPFNPHPCPEWCHGGVESYCLEYPGGWNFCRCTLNEECEAGTHCTWAPPYDQPGVCRDPADTAEPEPQHADVCPLLPSLPAQSGCTSGPKVML